MIEVKIFLKCPLFNVTVCLKYDDLYHITKIVLDHSHDISPNKGRLFKSLMLEGMKTYLLLREMLGTILQRKDV